MIISIASGKGGTGKTLVATNLAKVLDRDVLLLDCDVEEPNCHIFLNPHIDEQRKVTIPVPKVNLAKCDRCGKCAEICRYNAIIVVKEEVLVFPELCHGCGGCGLVCTKGAIDEIGREIGVVEKGWSYTIEFVHGKLRIGEPSVPPLIKAVKSYIKCEKTVIIDSPPGTSCSVIESVKNSDICLLVTEPTPFGLYDLKLAVDLVRKLKIPFRVIINKCNLGDIEVYRFCETEKIEVVMEIPIDKRIAKSYSNGILIVKEFSEYNMKFQELMKKVLNC